MGGGGKNKSLLSKATGGLVGDNSVVSDLVNGGVKASTAGTFSTDGSGSFENGNPLEGNKLLRGVAAGATINQSDTQYFQKKDLAQKMASDAQSAAKKEQGDLIKQADDRKASEATIASAADDLAKRKSAQARRGRLTGRQSTIVTGTADGEQNLGTISTGKSLLGV